MFNIIETNKAIGNAIGDIHGEFKGLANWLRDYVPKNSFVIFCGDFGLGFSSIQHEHDELLRANRICDENDIDCYIIRGNHDNPEYYNKTSKNLILSRFKPLSDYSVIKCPQANILCLGGAVSTDRTYRQEEYERSVVDAMKRKHCTYEKARQSVRKYWWEDEGFVYNEDILNEINDSGIKIDCICSHSAPMECYPFTSNRFQYWCSVDDKLEEDIKQERNNLSKVYQFLKEHNHPVKEWRYGHFHEHHVETINDTRFVLLDMGRNGKKSDNPGSCFDMFPITY